MGLGCQSPSFDSPKFMFSLTVFLISTGWCNCGENIAPWVNWLCRPEPVWLLWLLAAFYPLPLAKVMPTRDERLGREHCSWLDSAVLLIVLMVRKTRLPPANWRFFQCGSRFPKALLTSVSPPLQIPLVSRGWFPRNATDHDNELWQEQHVLQSNRYSFHDTI